MDIGILYIAIGKYTIFWDSFYESVERFFLPNQKKNYYIFTDSSETFTGDKDRIRVVKTENRGWPYNTLMRFSMFESISEELKKNDYLFFFNANLLCVNTIEDSFLPVTEDLLVAVHPGYMRAPEAKKPFCRDKNSTAYVPYGADATYVQGALNGGKAIPFLKMIEELAENVRTDESKGIIANVHDESHLNRYIIGRNDVKYVGPEYLFAEGYDLSVDKTYIINRDKRLFFDVEREKMGFIAYQINRIRKVSGRAIKWMKKR